jgi:small neutral amino acid transporter SnatA (MarC family)
MDPVTIKFLQLIGAELLGAVLVLGGLWQSFRALEGKSNLFVQFPGVKAKMTNATPGVVVTLIGVGILYMSLGSKIERRIEETTLPTAQTTETAPTTQTTTAQTPTALVPSAVPSNASTGTHTTTTINMVNPPSPKKQDY